MLNKKGSHVGMILSFVVFITFIVFLYSIVKPAIDTGEDKKTTLDYIERKIEENTSTELASITISIKEEDNPSEDCIRLEQFFYWADVTTAKVIVKDETGMIQTSYYDPARMTDLEIDRNDGDSLFFRIYGSQSFDVLSSPPGIECELVKYISAYNITSITIREYLLGKNIYWLKDYYYLNYDGLKTQFNIPPGTEFAFEFVQSNGTRIIAGNASERLSVYARETPIQYLDEGANIQSGFINTKVW